LLVASPDLEDPNFRRTVVLMLTHDAEGALGLVLNRPSDIPMGDELPAWVGVAAAPACLYLGGPVDPDAALGLGEGPPDRSEMIVGLVGAVDFAGRPEDYRSIRVFAGYAGWGPSQLDTEVARGDWIVVDALVDDITTAAPDALWREVLRRQRSRVSLFASAPDDPSMN
jgi:Putative transcriptional regulator